MRRPAALLVLVVLTGCGGGDSSSDTGRSSPPTTRALIEIDKERAARTVLTAADLPGYTEDTTPDTGQGFELAAAGSVQNDPVLTAKQATSPRTVEGKDFTTESGRSVDSEAIVAETEDMAKAALNQVRSAAVIDCIGRAARTELAKVLDPGITLASVAVTPLPVASVGDEAVGLRFTATLSAEGETARAVADVTFIRREREVARLTTGATGSPFPEADRASLATRMADRMAP